MAKKIQESLEEYLLSVIEDHRPGKGPAVLRFVLRQLAFLFEGIVQTRLFFYRTGIMRHHALGCQVISVGNLTVGGTGKTPVAEVLARSLQKSGRKVAILSRGYKKEKTPFKQRMIRKLTFREDKVPPRIVSDGERLLLDSAMSGDEPYMLASNLPEVAVLVDKNRVKSGRFAIKKLGCDTLILDDGFQHLALKHRLDIVLVDRTKPFGNNHVLPRGILREPPKNIKRAGFIFITKSNGDGAEELRKKLRELNPTAEISECCHRPKHLVNVYTRDRKPLSILQGMPIIALSGIASPKGFEDELGHLGSQVLFHQTYADHHRYNQQEIIDLINGALEQGAQAIITTEKDAVRMPHIERRDVPIYYLRVEIEMLSGEEQFYEWINRICFTATF